MTLNDIVRSSGCLLRGSLLRGSLLRSSGSDCAGGHRRGTAGHRTGHPPGHVRCDAEPACDLLATPGNSRAIITIVGAPSSSVVDQFRFHGGAPRLELPTQWRSAEARRIEIAPELLYHMAGLRVVCEVDEMSTELRTDIENWNY